STSATTLDVAQSAAPLVDEPPETSATTLVAEQSTAPLADVEHSTSPTSLGAGTVQVPAVPASNPGLNPTWASPGAKNRLNPRNCAQSSGAGQHPPPLICENTPPPRSSWGR